MRQSRDSYCMYDKKDSLRITFGANVCGNNTNKKLGVPVTFEFDVIGEE